MTKQEFYVKIFILIGLALLSTNTFAQDPNFHIYLCFGQSNMEGAATIEEQDRIVNSRFQVLQSVDCSNFGRKSAKWYKAVPPLCRCWTGLSVADYFRRTMVENSPDSIRIGVVHVAIGGCDIRLFDKDIYQDYDSTYTDAWFQDILASYGDNPYQHLVDLAKLAQQDGVVKGILLHQGETNTGNSQWPNYVKKIYNDMLIDLSLEADSVPLLAGELVHADQGGVCASMNSIIAKLPDVIPTAYVISSSGCADKSDNIHFNSAGAREMGKRYAETMLSLIEFDPTSVENLQIIPNGYTLEQNYPNPFNPTTNITFSIPQNELVQLKVYDLLGNEILTLLNEIKPSGTYNVEFDAADLSSGIYLYKITSGNYSESKKMILLR